MRDIIGGTKGDTCYASVTFSSSQMRRNNAVNPPGNPEIVDPSESRRIVGLSCWLSVQPSAPVPSLSLFLLTKLLPASPRLLSTFTIGPYSKVAEWATFCAILSHIKVLRSISSGGARGEMDGF